MWEEGGWRSFVGETRGVIVEEVVANSILPKFSNTVLDKLREDRYAKQEKKLLTRFRDVKGESNDSITFSIGRGGVELDTVSFPATGRHELFRRQLAILHAPNGTGKTALLGLCIWRFIWRKFPSRTMKDDSASFATSTSDLRDDQAGISE
jgi:hypothetical protein